MKKIKVLTSLAGLTGLTAGLVPVMSACSNKAGSVELAKEVTDKSVSVKSYNIVKGQDSTIEFTIPSGRTLTAVEVTVGNEEVNAANWSISGTTLTIKAEAMIDNKVYINNVTLGHTPTPTEDVEVPQEIKALGVSVKKCTLEENEASTIEFNLPDNQEIKSLSLTVVGASAPVAAENQCISGPIVLVKAAAMCSNRVCVNAMELQAKTEKTQFIEKFQGFCDNFLETASSKTYTINTITGKCKNVDSTSWYAKNLRKETVDRIEYKLDIQLTEGSSCETYAASMNSDSFNKTEIGETIAFFEDDLEATVTFDLSSSDSLSISVNATDPNIFLKYVWNSKGMVTHLEAIKTGEETNIDITYNE